MFLDIPKYSLEKTCARASLLKKRLWDRWFLVNFVKFLRTPFYIEHLWWLLQLFEYTCHIIVDIFAMKKNIHGKLYLLFLVFQKLIRCEMVRQKKKIFVFCHSFSQCFFFSNFINEIYHLLKMYFFSLRFEVFFLR